MKYNFLTFSISLHKPYLLIVLTQVYILNKQWYNKWKNYINYSYFKNKSTNPVYYKNQVSFFNHHLHPGPISNNNLVVNLCDFVNDGNAKNDENIVIKSDIDFEKNIKIIDNTIWKFFFDRYKGGPEIKKPYKVDRKNDKKQVDLSYQKVRAFYK